MDTQWLVEKAAPILTKWILTGLTAAGIAVTAGVNDTVTKAVSLALTVIFAVLAQWISTHIVKKKEVTAATVGAAAGIAAERAPGATPPPEQIAKVVMETKPK